MYVGSSSRGFHAAAGSSQVPQACLAARLCERSNVRVHSGIAHQRLASRERIDRPSASALDHKHQQAAGYGEILLEVQQLVLVRKIGVEEEGSHQTKQAEAQSAETCLEAERPP